MPTDSHQLGFSRYAADCVFRVLGLLLPGIKTREAGKPELLTGGQLVVLDHPDITRYLTVFIYQCGGINCVGANTISAVCHQLRGSIESFAECGVK